MSEKVLCAVRLDGNRIVIDPKNMIVNYIYRIEYQGNKYQVIKRKNGNVDVYEADSP